MPTLVEVQKDAITYVLDRSTKTAGKQFLKWTLVPPKGAYVAYLSVGVASSIGTLDYVELARKSDRQDTAGGVEFLTLAHNVADATDADSAGIAGAVFWSDGMREIDVKLKFSAAGFVDAWAAEGYLIIVPLGYTSIRTYVAGVYP